jgi:hypothetical protein
MGILDKVLRKKERCEQCDAALAADQALPKRGFKFCSTECVELWVAANPPPRATGGDLDSYRKQAVETLALALGELHKARAADSAEITQSSILEYERYLYESLPFVFALDFDDEADELLAHDFAPIHAMTNLTWGPVQKAIIDKLTADAHRQLSTLVKRLNTGESGVPAPPQSPSPVPPEKSG